MRLLFLTALFAVWLAAGTGAAQTPAAPSIYSPQVATFVVHSRALGQDRAVFVALPRSWGTTTRVYPVVVVLDGEAHFPEAATVVQQLADVGHAPEAIVVGIPNAGDGPTGRVRDLTPPGLSVSGSSLNEGGDRMLDFLQQEVMPELVNRYRAATPMILIGHSSGAILATYAAATRSRDFPVVIAVDAPASLQDGWLADRLTEAAKEPDHGHLRYVSVESRFGWTDSQWRALEAAAPTDWKIRRIRLTGESHLSMIFSGLYEGLKAAFDDYSIVGAPLTPRAPARAAFAHYEGIAAELGASVLPPRAVLSELVGDLLTEGRPDQARRALAWFTQGYGAGPEAVRLADLVAAVQAAPPLAETVESLEASPRATVAEILPFVGEWRGENWINPAAKSPMALRIRIEDDRVVSEVVRWDAGQERVEPATYLRVTAEGLDFGRLNGMRPRAMVVHVGQRRGDVLEGEMTFRGVVFPLPGEEPFPPIRFRLERAR